MSHSQNFHLTFRSEHSDTGYASIRPHSVRDGIPLLPLVPSSYSRTAIRLQHSSIPSSANPFWFPESHPPPLSLFPRRSDQCNPTANSEMPRFHKESIIPGRPAAVIFRPLSSPRSFGRPVGTYKASFPSTSMVPGGIG